MGRPKKYEINEDYFKEINSISKAYILGFIFADGHVDRRLEFNISKKDLEILNFIKEEMSMTHPIKNNGNYCRLSVANKKLCTDLKNLGIPSNKNNSIKIPNIKKKFYSSFLLGFFDGDGHINDKESYLSFSGGENILTEIKNILENNLKFNMNKIRYRYSPDNKNSCSLEIKGTLKVEQIYNYLYKSEHFSLKRKRDKFLLVLKKAEKFRKSKFKFNGNLTNIMLLYKKGYTNREISKFLNINYNSVRSCVYNNKNKI